MFKVNPKTVSRWAAQGKITCVRTLGGHRRFRQSEVIAALLTDADAAPTVPAPAAPVPPHQPPRYFDEIPPSRQW